MSILRYFNKHQGWNDGKRTYNGGGGSWNPVNIVSDAVSSVSDALASVDPGPAIGSGLASVDQAVNQVPGGWYTVGALAAGGTALAFAPEIAAAAGISADTAITSELGQQAFFDALANGATSTEAINAGVAADTAATAATTAGATNAVTSTPGADAILAAPDVAPSVAPSTGGSFGSITAPATGSGAIPGAGATTLGGGGLTGALPAGVVVGDGTLGTTVGATYMATDAGTLATDMFGNAIPASSTGVGGFAADTGLSASDIATNAKRLQSIAKLLGTGSSAVSGRAAPTAQQWNQQATSNLAQATPQQFGGLYEMNKSPFTFANPLANALSGGNKQSGVFDVSGTPGTSLNTTQQNKIFSSLLRS